MLLSLWIPLKTLVFLIGVLEWQDTGLATYSKENRQDQRLYEVLATRGVPKSNMLFMKEKSAILDSIVLQFEKILKKSDKESTFFSTTPGMAKNQAMVKMHIF